MGALSKLMCLLIPKSASFMILRFPATFTVTMVCIRKIQARPILACYQISSLWLTLVKGVGPANCNEQTNFRKRQGEGRGKGGGGGAPVDSRVSSLDEQCPALYDKNLRQKVHYCHAWLRTPGRNVADLIIECALKHSMDVSYTGIWLEQMHHRLIHALQSITQGN